MQQSIITAYPNANIRVLVVWIQMYPTDTLEVVRDASLIFTGDNRVSQYYDRDKEFGLSLAKSLEASGNEVAWDIYLYFNEETIWGDQIPSPLEWMHQLEGSSWADHVRLFQGDALSIRFQEIMRTLYQE